jgi:hypothetical protein
MKDVVESWLSKVSRVEVVYEVDALKLTGNNLPCIHSYDQRR